ncbi:hypothetical protein RM780_03680 [Streptomyces sp. DSM 44917]|uniref:ABC transporter permease n=1 Tax=Streptomyces boetiae TaxID=3075541 RepID=A0ABU2L3C7_9ACTN|nr:hypothetical protein [Streptomyces sp. DSM 44917]MDT0306063.1 hypothetical protein [Streptomyces sp. DSM 44917]
MIWWLKARRALVALPLGLTVLALLALVIQDGSAALPSLTISGSGSTGQTRVMLFAPIPLVASVALCLDARLPPAEASGVRPVRAMDALLVASVTLAAVALCLGLGAALDSAAVAAAGRNSAFLTGLLLCVRPFAGQPAVMVPVAWVLAVVLIGFRSAGDPYAWAILPEPPGAPHAALGTALVLITGLAALLRGPRSPT